MDLIRIGVIGLGCRGRSLLNTSLSCEGVKTIALCDNYQDRIDMAIDMVKEKQEHKIKVYSDYKKLLADEEIDAVIIASSWDEHIRMAIESMKAGKITAMEVGGAYDLEECWELVRTYEETKTPIKIKYILFVSLMRYEPIYSVSFFINFNPNTVPAIRV